ncbi:hypothetical protein BD413DRAFT_573037 [Trametes elegans]|nr:hypothetical protein BD413DRAFT_573037 [Trametes elegans]
MPPRQQQRTQSGPGRVAPPESRCQVITTAAERPCLRWGRGEGPRLCQEHRNQHTSLYLAYKADSERVRELEARVAAEPDWTSTAHWNKHTVSAAVSVRREYVSAIDAEIAARERHRVRFIAEREPSSPPKERVGSACAEDVGHAKWMDTLRQKKAESEVVLVQLRRCQAALDASARTQQSCKTGMQAPSQADAEPRRIDDAVRRREHERTRMVAEALRVAEGHAKAEVAVQAARQRAQENARRLATERALFQPVPPVACETEPLLRGPVVRSQTVAGSGYLGGRAPALPYASRPVHVRPPHTVLPHRRFVDVEMQNAAAPRARVGRMCRYAFSLLVLTAVTAYLLVRFVG